MNIFLIKDFDFNVVVFISSKACHIMHWRFWHKDECVEIVSAEEHEESSFHETQCFLLEHGNVMLQYIIKS